MNCYKHHDKTAYGLCKSCGKALCDECLTHVDNWLCCASNEKCQENAENLQKQIKHSDRVIKRSPINMLITFGIFILLFVGYAVYNYLRYDYIDVFSIASSCAMLVVMIALYFRVHYKNKS